MRKGFVKKALVSALLVTAVLGNGSITGAAASTPKASTAPTVMTDNLFKYGLKKEMDLPVKVVAGGLSYTLHKMMIYDFKSSDAKSLREKYNYQDTTGSLTNPKYFIWTKVTIANNSQKIVQQNWNDLASKWRITFSFKNKGEAEMPFPIAKKYEDNSKEALFNFKLKPGESLTTYQALYYEGDFDFLTVFLRNNGETKIQYLANDPDKNS
ncbi:hypothetical protein [Paenibacillus sp. FSL P4-0288]|uniref:hypothetical protein n=1 Tax=Paenibacillus sp. FSL P4-0288 TaxID=2921633 RepID=UPI0030F9AAF0